MKETVSRGEADFVFNFRPNSAVACDGRTPTHGLQPNILNASNWSQLMNSWPEFFCLRISLCQANNGLSGELGASALSWSMCLLGRFTDFRVKDRGSAYHAALNFVSWTSLGYVPLPKSFQQHQQLQRLLSYRLSRYQRPLSWQSCRPEVFKPGRQFGAVSVTDLYSCICHKNP